MAHNYRLGGGDKKKKGKSGERKRPFLCPPSVWTSDSSVKKTLFRIIWVSLLLNRTKIRHFGHK